MYQSLTVADSGCRTQCCPHCQSTAFRKHGFFHRKDDSRKVRRFRCSHCARTFSRSGFSVFYRHRHRRLNRWVGQLLTLGLTLRGIAQVLRIDKDTVARRLVLLARVARHDVCLDQANRPLARHIQFDELITIEHTKLKPVSVMVVSDTNTWRILGVAVSRIPASGHLAEKSRKKYGYRPDESRAARHHLLASLTPVIAKEAEFVTDEHSAYGAAIRRYFPDATHIRHTGGKGAVSGQGELKKLAWDPLFCINHQLAMHRANISRLIRRTWNTTKRVERLADHLVLFQCHYNRYRRPKKRIAMDALLTMGG